MTAAPALPVGLVEAVRCAIMLAEQNPQPGELGAQMARAAITVYQAHMASDGVVQAVPVAWQRRRQYPLNSERPQWAQCSKEEAIGHFERLPGYGYRPLYATPQPDPRDAVIAELREAIISTPETADFMAGVPLEAAHQRERWGSDHDAGKTPFDWFWLIGYLSQKAADAAVRGDNDKALHHTISTAAALANWHAALSGASHFMRPGIAPPAALANPEGK